MEILFLTTVLPDGQSTGGEIASQAVVSALAGHGHAVTVLGYRRKGQASSGAEGVVEAGRRPIETDAAGLTRKLAWMGGALIHALPFSAAKYRSRRYRRAMTELIERRPFELVIVDHAQSGWVERDLRKSGLPFAALLHNVEHRLYADRAAGAGPVGRLVHGREARRVRSLEEEIAHRAAAVWVLADEDAAHFARSGEVRTLRIPSALLAPGAPLARRRDVALIGTWTWHPTRQGLEWFVERVCPLLPSSLEVGVAGRGGEWLARSGAPVRYHGIVADAMEFLSSARVVAVPSLGGTGVQVKTLDAIASGSRVVATAAGVRGLGTLPDSVRVAHTPEEFAAELTKAAQAPDSLEPNRDALAWTHSRRERFTADVGAAVEAAARAS